MAWLRITRGESKESFRFLGDAEFAALSMKAKAIYLARASHELEALRHQVRHQMNRLEDERNWKGA